MNSGLETSPDSTGDIQGPEVVEAAVIESSDAVYPDMAAPSSARVELIVTVLADGSVGPISVAASGGEVFDAAAIAAVLQWRFEPARRYGKAIDGQIRVPFEFSPPGPESVGAETQDVSPLVESAAVAEDAEDSVSEDDSLDVVVTVDREARNEERSAGDFKIERDVLAAAPRKEGAEVLRSAPGVYIGRAEGPAVAHNYMLRGFDAEHGQDIEFRVGGLPINIPSHIHGQGYSDLSFLIGDVVRELRVSEGVYDPRQGDFAVAGSIDMLLGVEWEERGTRLRSGFGSWDTFRHLVLWAPEDGTEETFGAMQYMSTDGFGENRAGQSASGIFQHRFGSGDLKYRLVGILHLARSDLAGIVRQDDIDSGLLCFDCVYEHPTARAQNALANRFIAGFFGNYAGHGGANGEIGLWIGYDNFRLQANYTGFLKQSRVLERVGGRGDLIEQQNRTLSFGLTSRYRSSIYRPASCVNGTIEVGSDGRLDVIDQTQNLIDASVRSQTWDRRVDASILGVDLGVWGDLAWNFTRFLEVRAGMRADALSYDVEDRLGNFAPLTRPQDAFIPGFRRSAMGLAWGPRLSLEAVPFEWMSLLAAYGEGYRSPQARLLEDGEATPFSKVESVDIGVRFDFGPALHLTLGAYTTQLSDDIAFSAAKGRLERIGATERVGAVVHAVTRPWLWLVGSFSLTFVDATLLEPPPPSAEEPQPPFTEGQNLPFAPPMVIRADLGVQRALLDELGGQPLGVRAGLGFSALSPRPLPFGEFSESVALLDVSAGLSWGPIDLTFELFNAFDSRYAAIEDTFPSDWSPDDGTRARTPARHIAAGAPLSWMLSLGVKL